MYADVSIVIPCFNHNEELSGALHSICKLEVKPRKVIVVDDGSDVPVDIPVAQEVNIALIRQENKGLACARNTGLVEAETQWVLFLDADDELLPNALNSLSDIATTDVICSAYVLDKQGKEMVIYPQVGDPIAALLRSNIGPPASFFFRTSLLKELRFNESADLRKGHEDYDLLCRLALTNATFSSLHKPTARYIKREGSMSTDTLKMAESRVIVWSGFFLQLRSDRDTYLLAAFHFLAEHWGDILKFRYAASTEIISKLNQMIKCYKSSVLDFDFLFNKLPSELREHLLPFTPDENNVKARIEVANEVFDWRGRDYQRLVTYERFTNLLCSHAPDAVKGVYLIGANTLAASVIEPMNTVYSVQVIDDTKAGADFMGATVKPWQALTVEEDLIYFIASYSSYTAVKNKLLASGVKEECII